MEKIIKIHHINEFYRAKVTRQDRRWLLSNPVLCYVEQFCGWIIIKQTVSKTTMTYNSGWWLNAQKHLHWLYIHVITEINAYIFDVDARIHYYDLGFWHRFQIVINYFYTWWIRISLQGFPNTKCIKLRVAFGVTPLVCIKLTWISLHLLQYFVFVRLLVNM